MMEKICFVVQRYGLEINGGAELLTREFAERLTRYFDVTVLTTTAKDYMTWKPEYPSGEEDIHSVHVIRFDVEQERNQDRFDSINGRFLNGSLDEREEREFVKEQGPYVPELISCIRENRDRYSVFIFCTYLYYPSVMGVKEAGRKAILAPFAHDEPYMKMRLYHDMFQSASGLIFETPEERRLIRDKFHNYDIPYVTGGAGVDVPDDVDADRFKRKYGLDQYIIYAGRIDEGKNCPELFSFFTRFKKEHPSNTKLVLIGKPVIDIPEHPDIVSLGFVSEQDKFDGIAGAQFLVLPSRFESLSIVVLEAFSLNVPVLVNGACAVLKGHCDRCGGGFYYYSYDEFSEYTSHLLEDVQLRSEMGKRGKGYVVKKFNWDVIIPRIRLFIDLIGKEAAG